MNLQNTLREEQLIMDEYAADYDAATLANSYVYQLERARFAQWVIRQSESVGPLSSLRLLDAGCATGLSLGPFAEAGFGELIGIDVSSRMLEVASQRCIPRTRYIRGSIEHVEFSEPFFDVVVALFTLHHLTEPRAFFELLDKSLRPGGAFFILDYDTASGFVGDSSDGARRRAGDLIRKLIARKNRGALAAMPALVNQTNSAHRYMDYADVLKAMPDPDDYDLRQDSHGIVLPAFLKVLVRESAIDRGIASLAQRLDVWFQTRRPGLFQWIMGRRRA